MLSLGQAIEAQEDTPQNIGCNTVQSSATPNRSSGIPNFESHSFEAIQDFS